MAALNHKEMLKELQDNGITNLDELVRAVLDDAKKKKTENEPRMIWCNLGHYCVWVKEK